MKGNSLLVADDYAGDAITVEIGSPPESSVSGMFLQPDVAELNFHGLAGVDL